MGEVLYFRSNLALVKVEDRGRSQVLTGGLQGRHRFSNIFIRGGANIRVLLELRCEFMSQ